VLALLALLSMEKCLLCKKICCDNAILLEFEDYFGIAKLSIRTVNGTAIRITCTSILLNTYNINIFELDRTLSIFSFLTGTTVKFILHFISD